MTEQQRQQELARVRKLTQEFIPRGDAMISTIIDQTHGGLQRRTPGDYYNKREDFQSQVQAEPIREPEYGAQPVRQEYPTQKPNMRYRPNLQQQDQSMASAHGSI